MKKYELVFDTGKSFLGIKLFRIRALVSFCGVTKGNLGGYVQSEANLSQQGDAWVFGDAQVSMNAQVSDNARVHGDALVCGDARVYENAQVSDNAQVYGNARVYGNAQVCGDAWVYQNAWISKLYQCCSITNLRFSFTSLPKGVQVGCKFHTMKDWKNKHQEIGKQQGFTPELSSAYYELMKAIRKVQRIESRKK